MWRRTQMSSSGSRGSKGERVEDAFAVPDERVAGAALQASMPQQRHEGRNEQLVGDAERTDRPHRLGRHLGMCVVQQRDQELSEARVGDLANDERRRPCAPRWPTHAYPTPGASSTSTLAETSSARGRCGPSRRQRWSRFSGSSSCRYGRMMSVTRSLPNVRKCRDGRGPHLRTFICDHPLDRWEPPLRDFRPDVAERPQHTHAHRARAVVTAAAV